MHERIQVSNKAMDGDGRHRPIAIDRATTEERLNADIAAVSGPENSLATDCICRYAFSPPYMKTVGYFAHELSLLDYQVQFDPVGNLVARNCADDQPAFGLGSHCDSVRKGGRFDGVLGVAAAVQVCRLNEELGLGLPLQVISFVEEEGSGFGETLLGSRIMTGQIDRDGLRARIRSLDDGRSFWAHAEDAGLEPASWEDAGRALDSLMGWIECHIEQGKVLEDARCRLGIVTAIAGYVHGDLSFFGSSDHAGATPMALRHDALAAAAEAVQATEQLATARSPVVGTVGEIAVSPNVLNIVPGEVRISLDLRGGDDAEVEKLRSEIVARGTEAGARRGVTTEYVERQRMAATHLAPPIIGALEQAAASSGEAHMRILSGAAHDTMSLAGRVPSGMIFIPCERGISHSPYENADLADAALAVEVMLNSIVQLV